MTSKPPGGPFVSGALVIVYLHDPREKIWGLLMDLGPAGVSVFGLGLQSFDDWLRGLSVKDEQRIQPSLSFYPLVRVEKILMDEEADGIPSFEAQCVARTGKGLKFHLALKETAS
ncbi:MAG TPA: hypothetical protein VFE84_09685 [Patescibacteria group bacterium]|jgi:hypothetical protein|nr:hypothetical protein [Patescibacteria group bacterium]